MIQFALRMRGMDDAGIPYSFMDLGKLPPAMPFIAPPVFMIPAHKSCLIPAAGKASTTSGSFFFEIDVMAPSHDKMTAHS